MQRKKIDATAVNEDSGEGSVDVSFDRVDRSCLFYDERKAETSGTRYADNQRSPSRRRRG